MESNLRENWNLELEMSLRKRTLLFFHISSLVFSQRHEYPPPASPRTCLWYLILMLGYGQCTSQALGQGRIVQLFFEIFLGVSGQQSNCVHLSSYLTTDLPPLFRSNHTSTQILMSNCGRLSSMHQKIILIPFSSTIKK